MYLSGGHLKSGSLKVAADLHMAAVLGGCGRVWVAIPKGNTQAALHNGFSQEHSGVNPTTKQNENGH
jgi:hypothetical protein